MEQNECIKQHWLKAKADLKKQKAKAARKEKAKVKKELEDMQPLRYWLNKLQPIFNRYINLRDKGKPCISCDAPLREGNINASHYFSVGSTPNLRFNEDNVHSSCIKCNKELHGNIAEYSIRLPKRIGEKRFKELISNRNKVANYTRSEVEDLIRHYKEKAKAFE